MLSTTDSCSSARSAGGRGSRPPEGMDLDGGRPTECDRGTMNTGVRLGLKLAALALAVGCGGTAPQVKTSKSGEPEDVAVGAKTSRASASAEPVPSRCIKRKGTCLPPVKWAQKLCQDVYPDVALYMFQKGSPWDRYYMRTGLNAVNGWGNTMSEDLVAGEEVIPISYRGNKDGFVVEGSEGTFDVLRWNGSCVTLDLAEVTRDRPGTPKSSRIEWRALSTSVQDALMEDQRVAKAVKSRQKECKGATIGKVSAECERLDRELGSVIARHVRDVGAMPPPASHP